MKKMLANIIKNWLKALVIRLFKTNKPIIIGITGSAGKSTTKEMIYHILNEDNKYHGLIKKSSGNLNTEIGLPLAILGFASQPKILIWPIILIIAWFRVNFSKFNPLFGIKILVLEYAADKPNDIKYLASFIKPDVAIITCVGPAHLQNYSSVDQIANEKFQLTAALSKHGVAILNKQDQYTKKFAKNIKSKIKYINAQMQDSSLAFAKRIGEIFDVNQKQIDKAIASYLPLKHRLNIIKIHKITIIDDSYNANPISMKLALEKLSDYAKIYKSSRKIAVIGDMLELGVSAKKYHQEIGEIARKNSDLVIAIGELSKSMIADEWFIDKFAAEPYLLKEIKEGDIILFKASRKIGLDRLVEKFKIYESK